MLRVRGIDLMPSTDAVAAVVFKISGNENPVAHHDAMTVTATVAPAACVLSPNAVISAASGVATYSGVTFTGYIGECTMTFAGKFTSSGTPASTNAVPVPVVRTVIASSMEIGTALPATPLVGGTGYTFTGLVLRCAARARD